MHPRTKTRTNKQTNTHIYKFAVYVCKLCPDKYNTFFFFLLLLKNIDFFFLFLPQSLTHTHTHSYNIIIPSG